MATTGADTVAMNSPTVPRAPLTVARRFTAAGAQAWPAETLHYDGAWAVRLSSDCAAKRQNCVTPLDPSDDADIDMRLKRVIERFADAGKRPRFLISPLASQRILDSLIERGWTAEARTTIQSRSVDDWNDDNAPELRRVKAEEFVAAHAAIGARSIERGDDLRAVLARIEPPSFLFLLERDDHPVGSVVCVRQGDMIGSFELNVSKDVRGKGLGKELISGVLSWAKKRKASGVWEQVEADNAASTALSRSLGFEPVYDYFYMSSPDATQ
ncbi:GNAT family N-acetyltransferase [Notoacmeibacter sp. MSK16QG-6]|uniref:GNAT family N-acetyltransferase n=1 Tax=Notoacmeibacter sp. MSK16QG-6 TaxID=2957982 RepID=UPI00209CC8A0|nr:GNAT family N-acetyltransferase [Notoacmeibacter sp. MSK16QG-6]MCP1199949.1 GNAT family N-acetyltransferase [Notoacmeibacter sp. MSK16QG-6]